MRYVTYLILDFSYEILVGPLYNWSCLVCEGVCTLKESGIFPVGMAIPIQAVEHILATFQELSSSGSPVDKRS